MEAIEESQINDRSIMEATVIERQDHSGRIRFKTNLPNGKPLESEWIQESDKTKGVVLWVEAVRGAIVAASQEVAAQALRKLQESRVQAPKIVDSSGQALNSSAPAIPITANSVPPAASSSLDPSAYVRVQYETAHKRAEELSKQIKELRFELEQVQKSESQWFGILHAMGADLNGQSNAK